VTSSQGIVITSFSGLVSNKSDLLKQNFDYIILDEGHKIRNPDAQITLAVKEFPTSHRIILSGEI
jgi:DNA excision repair protein ERCC-6